MTSWRQVVILASDEDSEEIQEALLGEGALGLEIDDDETRSVPDKPVLKTHEAKITATFERSDNLERRVAELKLPAKEIAWNDLADGDWENAFHKSWQTFTLGHGIWIVPSWEMVLHMDPGMAFGTGHHETTTLCARAIDDAVKTFHKPAQMKVLDVGTGTGILAMIAAKLGAGRVVATDNDPLACQVAAENCAKNNVHIEISELEPDSWGPVFDCVVANILALPLIQMATQLSGALVLGGTLLLSGVLNTQENNVRTAYEACGLRYKQTKCMNDWVLIELFK